VAAYLDHLSWQVDEVLQEVSASSAESVGIVWLWQLAEDR
jgi:hypothetical protein